MKCPKHVHKYLAINVKTISNKLLNIATGLCYCSLNQSPGKTKPYPDQRLTIAYSNSAMVNRSTLKGFLIDLVRYYRKKQQLNTYRN